MNLQSLALSMRNITEETGPASGAEARSGGGHSLRRGASPAGLSLVLRLAPLLIVLACFLYCVKLSWHWHVVQDAAIMHYVVFLMGHGMAPYRQIIDINGPGAYMSEWLVMHTFGPGSLAWRIYDYSLILAITGLFAWLTAPRDWMAGAFAGLSLGCYHIANGPNEIGERDWTILMLMLVGYAFLFLALRRRQAWPMFLFGLGFGAATTIKPLVAPIPFILLATACVVLYRRGIPVSRFIAAALLGALPPILAFVGFLYYWHAFGAFYATFRDLVSFYVGFGNPPFLYLLYSGLGRFLTELTVLAFGISIWQRSWRDYETTLLALGMGFGLFLYLAQRKAFVYQRASLAGFAFLWIALQSYTALRNSRRLRWIGGICLVLFIAGLFRHWMPVARIVGVDESRVFRLEGQLNALGGQSLNGDVQCVDMVQGCINTLYNMRLLQSTGFVSDFFLFRPNELPIFDQLRARFLADLEGHPPQVLIVAPYVWEVVSPTYAELNDWPAFVGFVKTHYRQIAEEPAADGTLDFYSYRLYVRR